MDRTWFQKRNWVTENFEDGFLENSDMSLLNLVNYTRYSNRWSAMNWGSVLWYVCLYIRNNTNFAFRQLMLEEVPQSELSNIRHQINLCRCARLTANVR